MSKDERGYLYRHFGPKYTRYTSDGLGRDQYINYNNGGFLQANYMGIALRDQYDVPKHKAYYSMKRNVAPFKYWSDGSGRDSYVLHESGGLKRDHKALTNYHLKDFLRTAESAIFNFKSSPIREGVSAKTLYISKKEMGQNVKIKKLEKGLVNRLYNQEKHKFKPEVDKK
jgi:hypothetical protein